MTQIECKDFFHVDWHGFLKDLGSRLLIIGNPPWVTNSALGALGGNNLPEKSNFQRHNGFAAKTGKANFDISEWMLIRLTEALSRRPACLAMLCKTSTARKVLRHAWVNKLNTGRCSLHLIDAQKHFGVSVDACLLIIHTGVNEPTPAAPVYPGLSFNGKISTIGLAGKELVADIDEYLRLRDIEGTAYYTWRSGVKHDAASVMEFTRQGRRLINGKRQECDLESTYLFPLLKSSDIANGRTTPDKLVLITQKKPSDDTSTIAAVAPKTWEYLVRYAETLDKRRSIIYEERARFSVFGIGDYTFAPWKVAISGLYKTCRFEAIGQFRGKPIALDDTCYFIPCKSEDEARFICELLNSDICQRFLRSIIFFDSKRPIKIDVLNRIDLMRVAEKLNKSSSAQEYLTHASAFEDRQPQLVFDDRATYRTTTSPRRRKPRA
ncbi:SAM-dependent methyltransferase [Candidatus Poribacteria bacterium]|nr:SAM-dependent methyltransferase [Candidatus Poribacteria bacterium]